MLKIFFALLILGASICFGQNHVTWELGFDYEGSIIQVKGKLKKDGIYTQCLLIRSGSNSCRNYYKKSKRFKTKGTFVEKYKASKIFDVNFDADVYIFEKNYLAEQQIKLKKNSSLNETIIDTTITYMICNDERCLPPIDKKLSIKLNSDE